MASLEDRHPQPSKCPLILKGKNCPQCSTRDCPKGNQDHYEQVCPECCKCFCKNRKLIYIILRDLINDILNGRGGYCTKISITIEIRTRTLDTFSQIYQNLLPTKWKLMLNDKKEVLLIM